MAERVEVDTRKRPNRLEAAITNPGAVKINVTGAFIVDDEPRSKSPVDAEGVHYENKDIRLPHHTGVVSHVAVDVSQKFYYLCPALLPVPPTTGNLGAEQTADNLLATPESSITDVALGLDRLAEHLRNLFISLESSTLRIMAADLISSTLKRTGSICASTSSDNSKRNTRSAMVPHGRDCVWWPLGVVHTSTTIV